MTRLRAHAKIVEFRAEDLRFTLEEAQQLLQKMLGVVVDEATIITIEAQTEGWVTGLRLAALAFRHRLGRENVAGDLSVSNRYVAEYLVQEILSQQAEIYSSCMLKLSILDRFNADLCQVLCFGKESDMGSGKINGRTFLDWLDVSNLFVIPLDEQHHWFRYHHLFREFLQNELRRRVPLPAIAELNSRATDWFEEQDLIEEALQHAFSAQNIDHAIHLVAQQRYGLMNQTKWQQIAKFLSIFPPQIVDQSLDLLMLKAWQNYHNGHWGELPTGINEIEYLIEQSNIPSKDLDYLRGEVSALRSLLCYLAVDPENAIRNAEKAITTTPPELWIVRVLARVCLAGALQMVGDLSRAYRAIYEGVELEPLKTDHGKASLIQAACSVNWIAADLYGMTNAAKQCITLSQKANNQENMGYGLMALGTAMYHRNGLQSAEENFTAVTQRPYQNYGSNLAYSYFGLAMTYQAQGHPEMAQKVAEQAYNFFLENNNTTLLPIAEAFQAEIALRQGRIASAQLWAERLPTPPPMVPFYRNYAPHLTLAKVWLAQNTPASHSKAGKLLAELYDFLVTIHNTQFTIEVLTLQALLAQVQGERKSAITLLAQALELAEPSGNIRLFIDYGDPIIDLLLDLQDQGVYPAYTAQLLEAAQLAKMTLSTINQSALVEPLTNRELEVLALLAERKTNKEIALQLGITTGTVRQHAYNLCQKLGVNNRRAAVTQAGRLGVLPV